MSDHFKTHGEAWRYCEKYGFDYISNDVFKIAEALLCAYKDGAKEPVIKADVEKPTKHSKCHWSGYLPD